MSTWSPGQLTAMWMVAGVVTVLIRVIGDRSDQRRAKFRRLYLDDRLPLLWRNGIVLSPVMGLAMILFGLILVVPPPWTLWFSLIPLNLILAAFVLTYRPPPPFMPAWLKREIESGATPLAKPDRMDWLLFWVVVPIAVLANIAIVALNLIFRVFG